MDASDRASSAMFQHTAARRRLLVFNTPIATKHRFQYTAARRRLRHKTAPVADTGKVSTHSRPKAAAPAAMRFLRLALSFNTQPPEGGCLWLGGCGERRELFQHTAARRRLRAQPSSSILASVVSTHSRPKAAANLRCSVNIIKQTFQHTAARRRLLSRHPPTLHGQSFNTQPPEGGCGIT